MSFNLRNTPISKRSIDTTELSIVLFVVLSFTVQVFSHMLGSNSLLIIALFGVGVLNLSLNAHTTKIHLLSTSMWLGALVVVAVSILRPSSYTSVFSINKYVDLFVFFAGIVLLIFSGSDSRSFRSSKKIILFFAVFYAFSVWIQILLPPLYNIFLKFLPETSMRYILKGSSTGQYYTGFTANAGYTAGYIVSGIIILFCQSKATVPDQAKKIILLLFLTLSLLMTGRRAHTLFLIIALAAIYVLPNRGRKFFHRIGALAVILLLLLLGMILFWDTLMQIPFFARIGASISGFLLGEDISMGRSGLYSHAWSIFRANPWFGIGWGNFRYTTVGKVTIRTEMEVHNVYLQLLTETGIVGLLLVMIAIIAMFISTLVSIRRLTAEDRESWFTLLGFSLAYQIFFILYSLTGNPFFDPSFLMMYFFSCSISMAFLRYRQQLTVFAGRRDEDHRQLPVTEIPGSDF